MATILGTIGNDVLFTTVASDTVNGGTGDDSIIASNGGDIYQGDTGYDTVYYSQLTQPITLKAFGEVVKQGGTQSDSLREVERVVATNSLGDTIDATGAGFPATGVSVNLETGRVNVLGLTLGFDVVGFENIIGSNLADRLRGDSQDNLIQAAGGNDNVFGGIGADTIDAGFGDDTVGGGAGIDILTGGAGNDVFRMTSRSGYDVITDYSPSAEGDNDTFTLSDSLDNGWSTALDGGIAGLTFKSTSVGAKLSSSCFFKGAGLTGAGLGYTGGIFVNTQNGEVRYNDGPTVGSSLLAIVSPAAANLMTSADFVFALV